MSTLYTNKRQNIKTFRYDWKFVVWNCPEYGICPVYGELVFSCKEKCTEMYLFVQLS